MEDQHRSGPVPEAARAEDPVEAFRRNRRLPWWVVALDVVLLLLIAGTVAWMMIKLDNRLEGRGDVQAPPPAAGSVRLL
ncbi:MAG: hypothetical protein KBA30_10400 [Clostridia bacterium]|nr:hypothetical protein [Clostridia bacterium]